MLLLIITDSIVLRIHLVLYHSAVGHRYLYYGHTLKLLYLGLGTDMTRVRWEIVSVLSFCHLHGVGSGAASVCVMMNLSYILSTPSRVCGVLKTCRVYLTWAVPDGLAC